MGSKTIQGRVPVSIRLPVELAKAVEAYADGHSLRKTDAYEHFLSLGLESASKPKETTSLEAISSKLDAVLSLLGAPTVANRAEVIETVRKTCELYPAVKQAHLFGSMARDEYSDVSDIDLRVALDRNIPFNLHDLAHLSKQIEHETKREVDIVSAEHIKNESLNAAIKRDGILIYERQK